MNWLLGITCTFAFFLTILHWILTKIRIQTFVNTFVLNVVYPCSLLLWPSLHLAENIIWLPFLSLFVYKLISLSLQRNVPVWWVLPSRLRCVWLHRWALITAAAMANAGQSRFTTFCGSGDEIIASILVTCHVHKSLQSLPNTCEDLTPIGLILCRYFKMWYHVSSLSNGRSIDK